MLSTVCLLSLQEWNLSWKLFHKKTEKPKNKFATEDLDHFLQEKKTFYFYFCKEEEKPQSALVGTNQQIWLNFSKNKSNQKNPENSIENLPIQNFIIFPYDELW